MNIKYGCDKIGYSAAYVIYKGGPNPSPTPTVDPTPTVEPTPTPTPGPCEPMPVANGGPDIVAKKLQKFTLGTPALAGTTYSWKGPAGKEFSTKAQATTFIASRGSWPVTVEAKTKCGVAKDTVQITIK